MRPRSRSSPGTRTVPGRLRSEPSIWTGAHIRRSTPRIPGRDSRRVNGTAIFSRSRPTHLKTGWIRRNGIPRSDRATLTEHWIRHGDRLTWVSIVTDPVYLTEPFIRSTDFELDPHQHIDPYPCETVTEVARPKGEVPNFLPGTNPFLNEFAMRHSIPEKDARGGADTMYPGGGAPAPVKRPVQVPSLMDDGEIHILPVQGEVYMLVGGGGNTTVQVGKDGVLVVDTKLAAQADKLIAAIRKISDKPIRYVINTSADADLTGGNEKVADAGRTITGGNVAGFNAGFPATMVAFEKVGARMREAGAPPGSWPQDTYFVDSKDLFVNGEAVQVFHQPAAHSDGDSLVFFRRSDVISAGDIFVPDRYPVIDVAAGGSINGVVNSLNRILDLTVPGG